MSTGRAQRADVGPSNWARNEGNPVVTWSTRIVAIECRPAEHNNASAAVLRANKQHPDADGSSFWEVHDRREVGTAFPRSMPS